jgi:hypothetical protein
MGSRFSLDYEVEMRFFAIAQNDNYLTVILNGAKRNEESQSKTKASRRKRVQLRNTGLAAPLFALAPCERGKHMSPSSFDKLRMLRTGYSEWQGEGCVGDKGDGTRLP